VRYGKGFIKLADHNSGQNLSSKKISLAAIQTNIPGYKRINYNDSEPFIWTAIIFPS
jgi:hypothetical protein